MKKNNKSSLYSRLIGVDTPCKSTIRRLRRQMRQPAPKVAPRVSFCGRLGESVWKRGQMNTIEVEFISPCDDEMRNVVFNKLGTMLGVKLKEDGSVRTSSPSYTTYGYQEAVISFRDDNYGRPAGILAYMRENGFSVNKTCGLHVHLDVRHMDEYDARDAWRRLCYMENQLALLVPEWTRGGRSYVNLNSIEQECDEDDLEEHHGRYYAINFESWYNYQTIEVRLHPGTVRHDIALGWTKLLNYLLDNECESLREVSDPKILSWIKWRGGNMHTTQSLLNLGVAI